MALLCASSSLPTVSCFAAAAKQLPAPLLPTASEAAALVASNCKARSNRYGQRPNNALQVTLLGCFAGLTGCFLLLACKARPIWVASLGTCISSIKTKGFYKNWPTLYFIGITKHFVGL